ncbi:MAG: ATP-binding protein [Rhizobiaceae bacterium]
MGASSEIYRARFIEDANNVILVGRLGIGKTHISTSPGHACYLKHRTRPVFSMAIYAFEKIGRKIGPGRSRISRLLQFYDSR